MNSRRRATLDDDEQQKKKARRRTPIRLSQTKTNKIEATMVKVWYQPPPYGPRTALNRPSYGNGGDIGPRWVVQLSKMPPGRVIGGAIALVATIAYIPLSEFNFFVML